MSDAPKTSNPVGDWTEYQRLVLAELERHGRMLTALDDRMREELSGIRVEIATLKVKAGVWGAIAGLIPVLLAILMLILSRVLG